MTELSNAPPIPETDKEAPQHTSPWIMLTSMLLLIAGLVLTSAMLVHYALERRSGADGSRFDLSQLLEKGKTLSAQAKARVAESSKPKAAVEEPETGKTTGMGMKRFFPGGNGAVRWPKLKLTGFGKPTDGEGGFAIINEKHVLKEQEIAGVKLVEIRAHGVVVEYKGERKTLAVDPTR